MTSYSLFDEEFIIKSMRSILDPTKIKNVKHYHNSIFKVSNVIDEIYDYDDVEEVIGLINNIYGMAGKKPQKGIYQIERKSGSVFYIKISSDTLTLGKSIRMKNKFKFIIGVVVLVILNYIFSILVNR